EDLSAGPGSEPPPSHVAGSWALPRQQPAAWPWRHHPGQPARPTRIPHPADTAGPDRPVRDRYRAAAPGRPPPTQSPAVPTPPPRQSRATPWFPARHVGHRPRGRGIAPAPRGYHRRDWGGSLPVPPNRPRGHPPANIRVSPDGVASPTPHARQGPPVPRPPR